MIVYCVSGKAGHGKDTFSRFLKEAIEDEGERASILHYADELKGYCKRNYNWNGIKDEQGRKLLQEVGTDIVKAKNPTHWIDLLTERLRELEKTHSYAIISDCRFPDEVELLAERGFDVKSIRVIRSNYESGLSDEASRHISEIALDHYRFDLYIENRSLKELEEAAYAVISGLR